KACVPTTIQDRQRREVCCSLLPPLQSRRLADGTKSPPAIGAGGSFVWSDAVRAFSSEMETGSREENASKQELLLSGKQEAERTIEREQVEQVGDRRAVQRNVGAVRQSDRVWHVVAAAMRDRLQAPIALDELDDRDVIGIGMRDVARDQIRRDHDQRDTGAVAEEVERLHIARVVVAAAFIEGDED